MGEDPGEPTSPTPTTRRRQIPVETKKPVKAYMLELGPTYSKEMVALLIAEGYTHYDFPDGLRIKIFAINYPCKGMRLEVGAATPEQYHLVAVMEEGWQPAVTH